MLQVLRERAAPLLLVGVLFGLLVLMSAQVTSGESTLLERSVFRLASPVLRLCSGSVSGLRNLAIHYVDLVGT